MRDLSQKTDLVQTIAPAKVIATTNGNSVDTSGFDAATIAFNFGVITDGTHTPSVQDSPDNATWTNVPASELIGNLSAVTTASGGSAIQSVGYIGGNRYLRAVVTVAGATSGGIYAASVLLGHPSAAPVA